MEEQLESWILTFRESGFECNAELRDRAYAAVHGASRRGASPERSIAAGLKVLALSLATA
jgi:hypothetical protein